MHNASLTAHNMESVATSRYREFQKPRHDVCTSCSCRFLAKEEANSSINSHHMLAFLHVLLSVAQSKHTVVQTANAPSGPGGAAQGIVDARGYLSTSIQYGVDPTTGVLVAGAAKQMRMAMANTAAVFSAAGYELAGDATACWIYGFNATTFGDISTEYYTFFSARNHPARNPTGATLALSGALVAVKCRGFGTSGERISIPNFFASDFNAQGLLVDDGTHLYTSAQIGADPLTGSLVSGGPVEETLRAMENLKIVFAAAFPQLGVGALGSLASGCQLMVVNDAASFPRQLDNKSFLSSEIVDAFASFFNWTSQGPLADAVVSISGFEAGSLPIPASVAVTCNGFAPSASRERQGGNGIVVTVGNSTRQLQASATLGADVEAAFNGTASVFAAAFSNACGGTSQPCPSAATVLRDTATDCELWLADPAADVGAALASLSALFLGQIPALTLTKAALPPCSAGTKCIPKSAANYGLQCAGSLTAEQI